MAARLELPALHKELDGFKHRFDKWAQQTVSAAEQLRDGHLRRVRQLQGPPARPATPALGVCYVTLQSMLTASPLHLHWSLQPRCAHWSSGGQSWSSRQHLCSSVSCC